MYLAYMYIPVRAAIKSGNLKHLLRLSLFDRPLMSHVELPLVYTIQPQTNKFVNKTAGD